MFSTAMVLAAVASLIVPLASTPIQVAQAQSGFEIREVRLVLCVNEPSLPEHGDAIVTIITTPAPQPPAGNIFWSARLYVDGVRQDGQQFLTEDQELQRTQTLRAGEHVLKVHIEPTVTPIPNGQIDPGEPVTPDFTYNNDCAPPPPPSDTTPPELTVPDDMTVQAERGEDGAVVTFSASAQDDTDGSATLNEDGSTTQDDVGGDITISCDPPSGSEFPIGETEVTCEATDAASNSASESFTVTVEEAAPLNEQFPDQGSCIEASKDPDAGFTKNDCKAAFKDKAPKPPQPTEGGNAPQAQLQSEPEEEEAPAVEEEQVEQEQPEEQTEEVEEDTTETETESEDEAEEAEEEQEEEPEELVVEEESEEE